ncbi:hypothetical protein T440DRAFT_278160 [Plenodomus tracheiphilus IPT5]|uniref:Uncharacterized protein n=1 Tax=Plenodomus tracheiphilus IPT5 TaxID=1408161 RepID=A0A6A7ASS9_9PLEO|nr:hypothetical protein T440DRAFT_278160 [Plenodomus tracheiphilus IPT5]
MSRPQSMPDFAALLDSSTSMFEKRIHSRRQTSPERKNVHLRKKPSLSLAAGLIMNNESPRSMLPPASPVKPRSREGPPSVGIEEQQEDEDMFYAYALRSDVPNFPPYILTFASITVCSRWWAFVKHEYPESARPSLQFFVVRSDHLETIRDDSKFYEIHNRWFYTAQASTASSPTMIPVQTSKSASAATSQQATGDNTTMAAMERLTEKLDRLAGIVEKNVEQIHALSVAQSAGLQHMQEINESNSSQIKAIGDAQLKLQALVDQNASHYIALSNTSFQSHEQTRKSQQQTKVSQDQTRKAQDETRDILKTTIAQLQTLSHNQVQLSQTCEGIMRSVESLSNSVVQLNSTTAISDTASVQSINSTAPSTALARRISPGPRKLNRRIKGVWYEYDDPCTPSGTPRRRVDYLDTPPKSPIVFKNVRA